MAQERKHVGGYGTTTPAVRRSRPLTPWQRAIPKLTPTPPKKEHPMAQEEENLGWYGKTTPAHPVYRVSAPSEADAAESSTASRMYGKTTAATKHGRIPGSGPTDSADRVGAWYSNSTPKERVDMRPNSSKKGY